MKRNVTRACADPTESNGMATTSRLDCFNYYGCMLNMVIKLATLTVSATDFEPENPSLALIGTINFKQLIVPCFLDFDNFEAFQRR